VPSLALFRSSQQGLKDAVAVYTRKRVGV
jgi:hypothetical protein